MFDFGEEFVIESYRVPWLIWVQLIVMVLLVLVLFCGFSVFALDWSRRSNPTSDRASSSSSQSHGKDPLLNDSSFKVGRNQSYQAEASTTKAIVDSEILGEEYSAKDIAFSRLLRQGHHPCDYFGLAKQAILKCFGLGYTTDSGRSSKHRKED